MAHSKRAELASERGRFVHQISKPGWTIIDTTAAGPGFRDEGDASMEGPIDGFAGLIGGGTDFVDGAVPENSVVGALDAVPASAALAAVVGPTASGKSALA